MESMNQPPALTGTDPNGHASRGGGSLVLAFGWCLGLGGAVLLMALAFRQRLRRFTRYRVERSVYYDVDVLFIQHHLGPFTLRLQAMREDGLDCAGATR